MALARTLISVRGAHTFAFKAVVAANPAPNKPGAASVKNKLDKLEHRLQKMQRLQVWRRMSLSAVLHDDILKATPG
jgi:hypothetical protein